MLLRVQISLPESNVVLPYKYHCTFQFFYSKQTRERTSACLCVRMWIIVLRWMYVQQPYKVKLVGSLLSFSSHLASSSSHSLDVFNVTHIKCYGKWYKKISSMHVITSIILCFKEALCSTSLLNQHECTLKISTGGVLGGFVIFF